LHIFIYRLPKKWICSQTKFHWNKRKLLPKFVYTIYGLPMMIMPLREFDKMESSSKTANDQKSAWEALLDGRIDVVATDHAPHTLEEKKQPYLKAPSEVR
jgi:hypothetical protein